MANLPLWAPTVKQVATRLMARTMTPNGEMAGTFNAETKPTAEQVNDAISQSVAFLTARLGPVPDALAPQAQALAALRTAYMVELGFFPEQTELSISPYRSLLMEYKEELVQWDITASGLEPNSPTSIQSVRIMTDYPGYTTPYPESENWF